MKIIRIILKKTGTFILVNDNPIKLRVLHPLGFITLIITFPVFIIACIFTEANILEIYKNELTWW